MWYRCSAWRSTPNEGAEVRVVWMTGPNVLISFIKRERAVMRFLSSPQICLQASSKESAVMRFLSSSPYNMDSSYVTYYKHNKKIVCPWGHQPILSWNSNKNPNFSSGKKKSLVQKSPWWPQPELLVTHGSSAFTAMYTATKFWNQLRSSTYPGRW
jgi:hypothetical protein